MLTLVSRIVALLLLLKADILGHKSRQSWSVCQLVFTVMMGTLACFFVMNHMIISISGHRKTDPW